MNEENIPWQIITLVRDPIMREVSDFFFTFHKHPELVNKKGRLLARESLRVLTDHIAYIFSYPQNWILSWFDKEFKDVFGTDVYQFPFNHSQGYTLIQQNNINILVFKLEKLSQCFSQGISEFLGLENIELVNRNAAKQKFYYDTYQYVLENIALSPELCEKIYSSKYAHHFYTEQEREGFIRKWTRQGGE